MQVSTKSKNRETSFQKVLKIRERCGFFYICGICGICGICDSLI